MEKSTIHAPIRVLALYDYKGWAWWHRLHNIKRYLPDDIELDIREVYENFIIDDYDLFMVFEEYLIPLLQYLPPQCLISGSSCARIACAAARAQTEKRCTATIFNSLEMYKSAGALPGMYCCQNGVDSVFFTPAAERPAKLTAAGSATANPSVVKDWISSRRPAIKRKSLYFSEIMPSIRLRSHMRKSVICIIIDLLSISAPHNGKGHLIRLWKLFPVAFQSSLLL